MNLLVIDCGTTSVRGILFSQEGRRLAMKRVHAPLIESSGFIEQDAAFYDGALTELCRWAADGYRVDAVSLTAFRSAPLLVDEDGEPLCRFIMWQDTRNLDICRELADSDLLVRRLCGTGINTVFTASKLTWLKRHRSELWARSYKAMVVPDFLIHQMTGGYVTDRTYGSRTLLMELTSGQWDERLLRLFDIEQEKLCRLIDPGTIAGQIDDCFAARTGLPAGIPVVSAGGDQQCAAMGLGLTDEGPVAINCGTGAYALTLSRRPVLDDSSLICNVSSTNGLYILEASIPSCAQALNAFLRDVYPEAGEDMAFLDRQVEEGTDGRAGRARALYRDLAHKLAACARRLPGFSPGHSPVFLSGGVSKSSAFNRLLAGALGCRLLRWRDPEATAIGAFAAGATALGLCPDSACALDAARSGDMQDIFSAS
ncbi:MAG: FGGY family carbohydrate kinase [Oscillospiraceae bacterium]